MSSLDFFAGGTRYRIEAEPSDFTHNMSATWVEHALTQYNNLVNAWKESTNSIPFFISTDQHGSGAGGNRWLAGNDTEIGYIQNINLGDSNGDKYSESVLNTWYEETCNIPNYIGVSGNHDFNKNQDVFADYDVMNRAFFSTGRQRLMSRIGYYTVYDERHNVKYLIVQPFIIDSTTTGWHKSIDTEQANWIIRELENDDGFDIVVLQHMPVNGVYTKTDGTTRSSNDFTVNIRTLFEAYRAKATGTWTDSDNVSHSFDFSNTSGQFLCTLHGHTHEELSLFSNNVFSFCADGFLYYHACTLGLIDRDNNEILTWRWNDQQIFACRTFSLGL